MLLSQSLIQHRSFRLNNYAIPRLEPVVREDYVQNGEIYQIEQVGPHIYYFFPPGSSVLSTPFVLVANALGVSAVNADGTFNLQGEQQIETYIAAILMAALAVVLFFMARLILPLGYSIVVTVAATLGTQIWSTTSRAMFTDTWPVLLLTCALFLILRSEVRNRYPHPFAVATLLVWSYFCYPLYIVHLGAVALYFLLKNRKHFLFVCATVVVWLAGFVIYSWVNFHQVLPNYFAANRLNFNGFLLRLLGQLFSPSRGLLVFVPTILIVCYLIVRFRKALHQQRLVLIAVVAVATHLFVISGFVHWWGGHSFGPRFATACIPWFALLAMLGVDAIRRTDDRKSEKRVLAVVSCALIAISIFIHWRGATAHATAAWNSLPTDIDKHPGRLWDWRHPQFLAGLIQPPPPADYPTIVLNEPIDFTRHDSDRFCWYGWSTPEAGGRWSDSKEAALVFSLAEIKPLLLTLKLSPFLVANKLDNQRLTVKLNGQVAADFVLTDDRVNSYSISLPPLVLKNRNVLTFDLQNATAPAALTVGSDERRLGIKLVSAEFRSQ